jgi:hypothetical protein
MPAAASNTISARIASARAIFRRRARLQFAPLGVVQLDPDRSSPPHAHLPDPKHRSGNHKTINMASDF